MYMDVKIYYVKKFKKFHLFFISKTENLHSFAYQICLRQDRFFFLFTELTLYGKHKVTGKENIYRLKIKNEVYKISNLCFESFKKFSQISSIYSP